MTVKALLPLAIVVLLAVFAGAVGVAAATGSDDETTATVQTQDQTSHRLR